jgi:hypothetical protein
MPDDPQALERLNAAVAALRRACHNARGEADWGDAMPHHPHQRAGMSWGEITALHQRPAKLPVDALDLEECDYFFSHSSYTIHPERVMRPALKYFLPRYASYYARSQELHPAGASFDPQIFGSILRKSEWWQWAAMAPLISEWLCAWVSAAFRFNPVGVSDAIMLAGSPERDEHRQCNPVLKGVIEAAVDVDSIERELDSLRVEESIRAAAACIAHRRGEVRTIGDEVRLPASHAPSEHVNRVQAGTAVVERWLTSDRLCQRLEDAVMSGQHAAAASEVYSWLATLRNSKK